MLNSDSHAQDTYAPFFETVIRYLGGLLSAYALKKDELLLRRADELAQKLDHVFQTPSGFPLFGVNPKYVHFSPPFSNHHFASASPPFL